MKISILLPYKENFSVNKSGAVSLFVNDVIKHSPQKKNIFVYGKTDQNNYLDNNYVNLNFEEKFLKSNSKVYINNFLNYEQQINSDIIEVHNRPAYIDLISKKTKSKIILYFHNDPLSMNGSKTLEDRNHLLSIVDHFIFNSVWSLNRFKIGLKDVDLFKNNLSVIYQSVNKPKINLKKKKKIVTFVGKLNSAKGYDIFGNAIIPVLNKFKDWSAIVIGDEPREKHSFSHRNLINYGYKDHKFILKNLERVSISVICSRWNEPLGRASLEACSRGSVPIITNKGGLPETSKSAVVLKTLNERSLTKKIERLISNHKLLKELQTENYKNFHYTPSFITKKIVKIRNSLFPFKRFNLLRKNSKIKILHITNFNERHNGRLHYNTGRRINNGFIRNNHTVFTLSDRDTIHNSKNLKDITGKNTFNNKILEINKTYKPNLIVIGHADNIKDQTFFDLKNINKDLKFSQWFLDPVSKNGPDYSKNKARLLFKSKFMDTNFLTSSPDALDFKINNAYYMPNPSDYSFEILENYKDEPDKDLFFAMSHGVHRGVLKKGKKDDREVFLNKLLKISNNNIKFDFYGFGNKQPVWGDDFMRVISNSKMGLNLSRGEPIKYYSSDRIAQLFGNGLLTFLDKKTKLNELFKSNEAIFYENISDLAEKILKYKTDSKKRRLIAKNGKKKYMRYFNSNIVSQFIIDKTFDLKTKNKYIWI